MKLALIRRFVVNGTVCAALAAGAFGGGAHAANVPLHLVPVAAVQSTSTSSTTVTQTEDSVASTLFENGLDPAGTDGAGNPCLSGWAKVSGKDIFGVVLWWFKMTTYYCYNYDIVTYHQTTETAGITATGSATGWSYKGLIEHSFHCYVASGSSESCSGNFEDAQGSFEACIVQVGCYSSAQPYIWEKENYKGYFYYGF